MNTKTTELVNAIAKQDLATVKALVKEFVKTGVDVNALVKTPIIDFPAGSIGDLDNGEVTTPLDVAAAVNNVEIAELLINMGAEPDINGSWYNALGTAATWGNPKMVKLLLDAGADPELMDKYGQTPQDYLMDSYADQDSKEWYACAIMLGVDVD